MSTSIGTDLKKGLINDLAAAGYYVQSDETGGADIDQEDFENGNTGARITRLIYKVDNKLSFEALAAGTHTESTIRTDFPEGAMCTLSTPVDLTAYFVDSCTISGSKSAWRLNIAMTDIGIT